AFVGIEVVGWVGPRTRDTREPILAFSDSGPTIGRMLCSAFSVWNERTMVSLCAIWASCGMVSPKTTPGSEVGTQPPMVRISVGASIFGSKVSNWLGPPCWYRKITDLPVTRLFGTAPAARAVNSDDNDNPPSAR